MKDPSDAFSYEPVGNCPCGAALRTEAGDPAPTKIWTAWGEVLFTQCPECGSHIQRPRITFQSLSRWYESSEYWGDEDAKGLGYSDYKRDELSRRADAAARRRRDIDPFLRHSARILEIGCASGTLVRELQDAGYDAHGLDISERLAQQARELNGLEIMVGSLPDVGLPDASFDAILLLGTISNLTDLPEQLAEIHRILRPGGLLYFNYPVADSLIMRLYGKRSWMFTPTVSTFFTRGGCERLLSISGFRVNKTRIDFQRPSLRKLFGHARLGVLGDASEKLHIGSWSLPISLPIPGVRAVWAEAET